jgi:excinuclease UvrABC nuclease subunit
MANKVFLSKTHHFTRSSGAPFWKKGAWKSPTSYDTDCSSLPKSSGVYIIVEYTQIGNGLNYLGEVVYVGSSSNLSRRYKSHNILAKIYESGNMRSFHFIPIELGFHKVEINMIRKWNPKYNKVKYNKKNG